MVIWEFKQRPKIMMVNKDVEKRNALQMADGNVS
jgi:hypothetical protein